MLLESGGGGGMLGRTSRGTPGRERGARGGGGGQRTDGAAHHACTRENNYKTRITKNQTYDNSVDTPTPPIGRFSQLLHGEDKASLVQVEGRVVCGRYRQIARRMQ